MPTRVLSDPRAREKPCLRCGTSLRAHLDDRYCPSCGLSVWLSLNANDALDASRPAWLRSTARTAFLLAPIQLLALLAWTLHFLATASRHIFGFMSDIRPEDFTDPDTMPYGSATQPAVAPTTQQVQEMMAQINGFNPTPKLAALALLVAGLYFVLNATGLFLLTTPELRYPDKQKTTRTATRITAAITAAFSLLMLASSFASLRPGGENHTTTALTRDLTTTGLLYLAAACFVATSTCLWLYLRPLATRGRRHTLRKLSSWLLFLPLLALAKAAPFVGFYFLYYFVSLLTPLLHFLPALYIPTTLILLLQYAAMLRAAAPQAEHTWTAESKPQ